MGRDAGCASDSARSIGYGRRPREPSERLVLALLARMPETVRYSFGPDQIRALRHAARETGWGRHLLDLRVTLPWTGGRRLYLILAGGVDRRERG